MSQECNSEFMRSWTKCFMTNYVGTKLGHFVLHFHKYRKWFYFESVIKAGVEIPWDEAD